MKIGNPHELVGKEVYDATGRSIGWMDKTWRGWNEEYPGYFFGIKTNEYVRNNWFRGDNKLIPIPSEYVKDTGNTITLNKTLDDLCHYWNKTVTCGPFTLPFEELIEKPVYDKYNSRVGTFCTGVERNGTYNNLGLLLDPYICETWHIPYNTTMPIDTNYITQVKDTVTLNIALHELKDYWSWKQRQTQP